MAAPILKNRAGVATATTGTGTVTLGAALAAATAINNASWQTFASAGVSNGQVVRYLILDSNGAWEYGTGTYTTTGTTLTRTLGASSTGALLNLSGSAQVFVGTIGEDIVPYDSTNTQITASLALCTGLPISSGVAGLGTGVATFLATPSSANLLATMTTETGTGNVVFSDSPTFTGTITAAAANFSGAVGISNTLTVTSASASALAVGRLGATTPAFLVDASAATSVTGLEVTAKALAAGADLSVISSGTNENFTLNAKGSGTITLGNISTGAITLTRATTMSAALTYGGVTLSNAVTGTGNMVLSTSPTLTTPVLGAATATTINGVTIDNNAWSTSSATPTAFTGTFTSVTGSFRYKQIGKTVHLHLRVAITTNGTAAGDVRINAPVSANGTLSNYSFAGRNMESNKALVAVIQGGTMIIWNYDGTYPGASGQNLFITGTYEAA